MENSNGESSLTVKWWGVLIVVFTVLGWLSISHIASQDRITKLEMNSTYVAESVKEIKAYVKEINGDLTEHINETRRNGR